MPDSVTSAELMVLGLLAEQPRHGYDANLPLLAPGEAINALGARAEELVQQLSRLQTHPQNGALAPPFVAVIFSHASSALSAELDWTHRTISTLEDRHA